jgi:hypothetical protein
MVFCRGNVNFETVAVMYCVHFITLTLPHKKKQKQKQQKTKTKQNKQSKKIKNKNQMYKTFSFVSLPHESGMSNLPVFEGSSTLPLVLKKHNSLPRLFNKYIYMYVQVNMDD